jgi:hypothetical protein
MRLLQSTHETMPLWSSFASPLTEAEVHVWPPIYIFFWEANERPLGQSLRIKNAGSRTLWKLRKAD